MKSSIKLLCVFAAFIMYGTAQAEMKAESCNNYSPIKTLFTDVCWSGMFPMRIVGVSFMGNSGYVPKDATKKIVCACGGDLSKGQLPKVGFTVGFWSPSKIIDVTRRPFCFSSLNGLELPISSSSFISGGANLGRGDGSEAFANWAMYSAPLVYMLRLLDEGACPSDGLLEFDILHNSALFPTHNDVTGRYTIFLNPEMMLFANLTSMVAFPVDAISSTLNKPINELFWVAGAWGGIYPITGFSGTGEMIDPVGFTSLIATRALAILHRLGLMRESIGDDSLCERPLRFIMRKDAFKWQMIAPSPESKGECPAGGVPPAYSSENDEAGGMALRDACPPPAADVPESSGTVKQVNPPSRGRRCTHATGASTAGWGMWRNVPATGEDHSYLLFQWTDCCFGATL